MAIVITLVSGLFSEGWAADAGRVAGFAACGALGGAALGIGLHPGAWKSGALGFGLGFVAPALLAGPALTELLALRIPDYGAQTVVVTALAFGAGYGLAGGLGAAFLDGRFAMAAGVRFAAAGGLGGLIAACGPAFAGSPSAFSPPGVIAALIVVVVGHMTACCLGGWLAGLGMENELKAQAKPKTPPTAKRRVAGARGQSAGSINAAMAPIERGNRQSAP
jgi:hypothetical protein